MQNLKETILWIRADGNGTIGMGHISRMCNLAQGFKKRGVRIIFLITDEMTEKFIVERMDHPEYRKLKSNIENDRGGKEKSLEEIDSIADHIKNVDPEDSFCHVCVVDSYECSNDYFKGLKHCFEKVIYVDDNNELNHQVDVIINPNIDAETLNYEETSTKTIFSGVQYSLIGEEYYEGSKTIEKQLKHIFFTVGGSDSTGATEKFIEAVNHEDFKKYTIHVIVGSAFSDAEKIKEAVRNFENIQLHTGVMSLRKIMAICDVALSSSGTTLYELCAVGLPTIAFSMAQNQERNLESFFQRGLVQKIDQSCLFESDCLKSVIERYASYEMRQETSEKMRAVFQKCGVDWVVEEVLKYLEEQACAE